MWMSAGTGGADGVLTQAARLADSNAAAQALRRLEIIKPGGIIDEDFATGRGGRRPARDLVERQPVIDVEGWGELTGFLARVGVVRVRPVGTPDDAVRVGGDQRPRQRRDVVEGRRLHRAAI